MRGASVSTSASPSRNGDKEVVTRFSPKDMTKAFLLANTPEYDGGESDSTIDLQNVDNELAAADLSGNLSMDESSSSSVPPSDTSMLDALLSAFPSRVKAAFHPEWTVLMVDSPIPLDAVDCLTEDEESAIDNIIALSSDTLSMCAKCYKPLQQRIIQYASRVLRTKNSISIFVCVGCCELSGRLQLVLHQNLFYRIIGPMISGVAAQEVVEKLQNAVRGRSFYQEELERQTREERLTIAKCQRLCMQITDRIILMERAIGNILSSMPDTDISDVTRCSRATDSAVFSIQFRETRRAISRMVNSIQKRISDLEHWC